MTRDWDHPRPGLYGADHAPPADFVRDCPACGRPPIAPLDDPIESRRASLGENLAILAIIVLAILGALAVMA